MTNTMQQNINFHPTTDLLVEYANGTLPWALTIGVATHVQLCSKCRDEVNTLNRIGASELSGGGTADINPNAFEHLMARVQQKEATEEPGVTSASAAANDNVIKDIALPKAVRKLTQSQLRWKKISSALKMARLTAGQSDYEVAFHQICKGGKVVEHDHKGLEVTIVLDGSFSDSAGVYQRGDFLYKQPGDVHRPTATQNEDCLCLSISEAPVKVTGLLGWLVNPFLRINPA